MRYYLPPDVAQLLDLSRLELVKESFADGQLQEHFSDLLYRVGLVGDGTAYIHLLLEHKSAPDDWVALQTLRYAMFDWVNVQRTKAKKLPVILPVVLYHGKAKWNVPQDFGALFEVREEWAALRRFIPQFHYHLCDLSNYTDDELTQGEELPPALLALRHVFSRDAKQHFVKTVQHTIAWHDERERLEFLETLAVYYTTGSELSQKEVVTTVNDLFSEQFSHIKIPLFEKWVEKGRKEGRQLGWEEGRQEGQQQGRQEGLKEGQQQGRQEGRKEGRQEGISHLALLLLQKKFDGLDERLEERIRSLSAAQLERLAVESLDFAKLQDLQDWLRKHPAKKTK